MNAATERIINVSNRLPIKIISADETITYQNSEGGLATGLSSIFSEYENIWIGWPGNLVKEAHKQKIIDDLQQKNLRPVFLEQEEINKFYEGFSNETIWPLFHYFSTYASYSPEQWQVYVSVNRKYADEILKVATKDDIIWVHDYHLMLVPAMLREAMPELTIGYFQHIPFPSYEIFRSLPWKNEVLSGLLGADIIGFQTEDDTHHFTKSVNRIVQLESKSNTVQVKDRQVSIQAFPISIDYDKYSKLAAHAATDKSVQKIREMINTKIIISIDRLDYSKGILQRLDAYDLFLKNHPEWHQKITYIHLVVPSRDNVRNYKELKEEMNKRIAEINGKYAMIGWHPIHHFYRSFPPNLLSALYKTADIALVTPLVDGMNLVCKEYIASSISQTGVLVLGEGAGAACELKDALIVNPNDVEDFANKIYDGLVMPEAEKKERMEKLQAVVKRNDIFSWAESIIEQLRMKREARNRRLHADTPLPMLQKIEMSYIYAQKRLLLLDYDGTLVPFQKIPEQAAPDAALLKLLKNLSCDNRTEIVVVSGRDKYTLDKWLGFLQINLVAEHGAWFREKNGAWYSMPGLETGWKNTATRILNVYSTEMAGTFTETKSYGLAWHYRAAEEKLGDEAARSLIQKLHKTFANDKVAILPGNKVVEIKSSMVNKGLAALYFLKKNKYDFIMAVGDDVTDEDMFKVLPAHAISIKVGNAPSVAIYTQRSFANIRVLLQEMYNASVGQAANIKIQLAS